ncbi:MAG: hypothetical protein MJ252_25845 [archaeon]|nr:hypothetical protein [archaeon]
MNEELINKIFDNIKELVEKKREDALKDMNTLKENYKKNIEQNIQKIDDIIDKSNDIEDRLNKEIKNMDKMTPFEFCKELLNSNTSSDLADECNDLSIFQKQEFSRIKQSFIDTNTIV